MASDVCCVTCMLHMHYTGVGGLWQTGVHILLVFASALYDCVYEIRAIHACMCNSTGGLGAPIDNREVAPLLRTAQSRARDEGRNYYTCC